MLWFLSDPNTPQNGGTWLRTPACLGGAVDRIEPWGFFLGSRRFRRAGMDYLKRVSLVRHSSWRAFQAARSPGRRLVVLTTRPCLSYLDFHFQADDDILVGSESAGVPEAVHTTADARLRVPMVGHARSLNVAVAAAMVLGEALRQTGHFPETGG